MTPSRRHSVPVKVGAVTVGGDAPIVVQSMTNTDTADAKATAKQVQQLAAAGSELVRITVNNEESAKAVPRIREMLDALGCRVPLIGDFHYNGHKLLTKYPACAEALGKYRINPGNVGFGRKKDAQFATMIETAIEYGKPVRIGVNWGSLDAELVTRMMDENAKLAQPKDAADVQREALITSALTSAARAEEIGLPRERIVLSCKVSGVQELIGVYQDLAARSDYALHLGLTEAGMGSKGIVASTAAMAVLLQQGIGDTIRVSLSAEPEEEVRVGFDILKSLGLRSRGVNIVSCPSCARQAFPVIRTVELLEQRLAHITTPVTLSIIGCVVNGPGEARETDIGLTGGGNGNHMVYLSGVTDHKIDDEKLVDHIVALVEERAAKLAEAQSDPARATSVRH